MAAETRCEVCGNVVTPGARICPVDGAPVPAVAIDGAEAEWGSQEPADGTMAADYVAYKKDATPAPKPFDEGSWQ